jgi:hypothetical protein
MGATTDITFGRFRLDAAGERVWEGSRTLTLRPKAFAILRYLIARPGELITKQELLEAVWPGTFITDGVLKESIRQLRDALGDGLAAPRNTSRPPIVAATASSDRSPARRRCGADARTSRPTRRRQKWRRQTRRRPIHHRPRHAPTICRNAPAAPACWDAKWNWRGYANG